MLLLIYGKLLLTGASGTTFLIITEKGSGLGVLIPRGFSTIFSLGVCNLKQCTLCNNIMHHCAPLLDKCTSIDLSDEIFYLPPAPDQSTVCSAAVAVWVANFYKKFSGTYQ
jgi:hypothetical protein